MYLENTLRNMIKTYKLTQNSDQVYDRFNVAMKDITSRVACFFLCFIIMNGR
jgi:hypothetical protein